MDEVLWWSVITESYREQVEQDAIEWATRWMAEGHGRAGIAGLLAAEEAAEYAGFEWAIAD
jgi:imidazole glycerol phosphate synthase subunit HisF